MKVADANETSKANGKYTMRSSVIWTLTNQFDNVGEEEVANNVETELLNLKPRKRELYQLYQCQTG